MTKSPEGGGPVHALWWWPRRRSVVLDAGLAAAAALECAAGAYDAVAVRLHLGVPLAVVSAVLGAAAGGTLLVRRRRPVVPVLVSLVFLPGMTGVLLLTVSLYTLTASWEWPQRRRRLVALSALALVESFGITLAAAFTSVPAASARTHPLPPSWAFVVLAALAAVAVTVPPVVTGLFVGARRRLIDSLKDRAHGLEAELGLLAEQASERARRARLEERTRIAREMHDVVAHRVSLMVVHAGALERVCAKDPEKAQASARLMGEVGRQALDELREILGVLRMAEPAPGGETGGGLAELAGLVEQSRAAGMPVSLTVSGERRRYREDAEQTGFRVVQEGLTNAHKHAGGARVAVLLAFVPNGVRLAVVNDRPGGDGEPVALPSGGNGLVGMRERVLALGGTFGAGPEPDGGFRVEAVLPSRLAAPDHRLG